MAHSTSLSSPAPDGPASGTTPDEKDDELDLMDPSDDDAYDQLDDELDD